MNHRIAITGASGTGKTTLATFLADHFHLPMNPIGSRSVSRVMGFANPYDVDAAGKRPEFQRRLLEEKAAWEADHDTFVTDRTVLDNLTYTALHDVACIREIDLQLVRFAAERYTTVFFCPMRAVFRLGDDGARKADITYHRIYEMILIGALRTAGIPYKTVWSADKAERQRFVLSSLKERDT